MDFSLEAEAPDISQLLQPKVNEDTELIDDSEDTHAIAVSSSIVVVVGVVIVGVIVFVVVVLVVVVVVRVIVVEIVEFRIVVPVAVCE